MQATCLILECPKDLITGFSLCPWLYSQISSQISVLLLKHKPAMGPANILSAFSTFRSPVTPWPQLRPHLTSENKKTTKTERLSEKGELLEHRVELPTSSQASVHPITTPPTSESPLQSYSNGPSGLRKGDIHGRGGK